MRTNRLVGGNGAIDLTQLLSHLISFQDIVINSRFFLKHQKADLISCAHLCSLGVCKWCLHVRLWISCNTCLLSNCNTSRRCMYSYTHCRLDNHFAKHLHMRRWFTSQWSNLRRHTKKQMHLGLCFSYATKAFQTWVYWASAISDSWSYRTCPL